MLLNLTLWFALHVLFAQLRPVAAIGLNMDLPVWSTLHMGALSLVIAAMAVALRFRLATVTVLAICALSGLTLLFAGVA